ncbi:winged helix-turn-helix transcriptional regulator [Miltoncostaea marina]|uniref:winged helix-turn-helix transcriptional regulator n=1 Tax=Miltoncostaea marina TaxID=2843215 RepID=UPI001C3C63B1|nr:helix-turn-helix domain-containing protein [Miltoncostaea marina]
MRALAPAEPAATECPVVATARIVSGKWTLLMLRDLAEGPRRFSALQRSLEGISPRTLSIRLRALEEEGIVERREYAEMPPRVEYRLTAKGADLVPIVEAMRRYGSRWLGAAEHCDEAAVGLTPLRSAAASR